MESATAYIDRLEKFMDKQTDGEWVDIVSLVENPSNLQQFIEAIKYLIDFWKKPYELSSNYTKVRRIEYEFCSRKKT